MRRHLLANQRQLHPKTEPKRCQLLCCALDCFLGFSASRIKRSSDELQARTRASHSNCCYTEEPARSLAWGWVCNAHSSVTCEAARPMSLMKW